MSRNDLLPPGHKWEHGHGLLVLGRSGVAILLLCLCGSCQCARAVAVQQRIICQSNEINNRESDLSSFGSSRSTDDARPVPVPGRFWRLCEKKQILATIDIRVKQKCNMIRFPQQ